MARTKAPHRWDRQDSSKNTPPRTDEEGIGEPFGKAKSVEEFRGLFGAGIFKTTNALQAEAKAQERFDVPPVKSFDPTVRHTLLG